LNSFWHCFVGEKNAFEFDFALASTFSKSILLSSVIGSASVITSTGVQTPIGQFSVKQSELDEYEEGTYEGRFVISFTDNFRCLF
jgi:hypothetical protein